MLPKEWTGNLVGLMHNNEISFAELADELGVTNRYVSAILNSHKEPAGAEERLREAVNRIILRKKSESPNAPKS